MAFSVSSAKVSITPTIAQNPYMAGYGAQGAARTVTSSTPYSQPLYVRCVVLWEDGYPHAIIGVDVLAIPRAMNQSIRQRLLPLAGWSNSDITLNANHTHNGPVLIDMLQPYTAYGLSDLTLVRSYSDWLEDRIVSAVQSALNAARTSVSMEYATTTASIAFNRVGLSEVERTVSIIIARAGNGSPRAIVWSYGCHPISADWQERWDGDWPAGACGLLESYYGSSCMPVFLQGAAGDQNPVYPWGWSQRDSHASVLYSAVRNAVNAGGRSLSGPLLTSYTDVSLPLQTLSLSTARSQYIGRFGNPWGQPAWYQRHAQVMVTRIDSGWSESSFLNPLQSWKFSGGSPLRVALVGGEVVSAYGHLVRNENGGSNGAMFVGYANEVSGYIPDLNFLPGGAFSDGSYEGGWEPDYPTIGGGNFTVYPHLFRFSTDAPYALIDALRANLA